MRLHVPIRLRWSDLDAYAHVNNAEMLRLLEEARIQAFWSNNEPGRADADQGAAVLDGRPGGQTLTLIARLEIEYLAPIPYLRQPIDIQLWLGKLGGASLDVCYEVWSPAGSATATLFARATTTIVMVDAATERPRKINALERAAWSPYLEPALSFARK
jgi:acyl-CoA thioester hydrolase